MLAVTRTVAVAGLLISSALALANQQGATGTAPAPPRADFINGRILGDDGRPLVNARVSAVEVGGKGRERVTRQAISDDEGSFRLTGLPPGSYQVSASAEAYLFGFASRSERSGQIDRLVRPGDFVTITLRKGGVITGKVTTASGQPVVGVFVGALRVRDNYERAIPSGAVSLVREERTDDRGVYRLYGLETGSYLIVASGRPKLSPGTSAHDGEAPTYHPSATRETAVAVPARSGEEVSGIDIRYRAERGRSIGGAVIGAVEPGAPPLVSLIHLPSGEAAQSVNPWEEDRTLRFLFNGIADGEYELVARRSSTDKSEGAVSTPRRVSVNGSDITGVELRLSPLSSLSGRIVPPDATAPERQGGCEARGSKLVEDVYIVAYREREGQFRMPAPAPGRPDRLGEFVIRDLEPGRHHLAMRLPNQYWYVRAMTLPGPPPARRPVDVAAAGVALKPGERLAGLTVRLAEGAAGLEGRVGGAGDGASLPARLRVHLVPAEHEHADNALRFAKSFVRSDGRFVLTNLAPGRYYLVAVPAPQDRAPDTGLGVAEFDSGYRAQLRREAQVAKVSVDLQPCQRLSNFVLSYASGSNR